MLKKENLLTKTFRMVILREVKRKLTQDESNRVGNRYPKTDTT